MAPEFGGCVGERRKEKKDLEFRNGVFRFNGFDFECYSPGEKQGRNVSFIQQL